MTVKQDIHVQILKADSEHVGRIGYVRSCPPDPDPNTPIMVEGLDPNDAGQGFQFLARDVWPSKGPSYATRAERFRAVQLLCPHCGSEIKEVGFVVAEPIWRTYFYSFDEETEADRAFQDMDSEQDGDTVEDAEREVCCGKCNKALTGDLGRVLADYADDAEQVW